MTYNSQKKLTGITDPLMRTTMVQYDSTSRKVIVITDPEGKKNQYTYNILYKYEG